MTRLPPGLPHEKLRAFQLKAQGHSATQIAKTIGRPRPTINGWLRKPMSEIELASASAEHPKLPELEKQVRDLKAKLTSLTEHNLTSELVRRQVLKLAEFDPHPPSWVPRIKMIRDSGTPIAVLSDVHWGEVVDLAATNGMNRYNIEIARRRLFTWAEKIITLAYDAKHPDYPGLVVCLGGDMMTGDIHDELKETNELPVFPAMLELLEVLISILRSLKKEFKRLFVACTFGNHGRNTKQVRFKRRAHSNFDWLLSCLLLKFINDPDIVFSIPTSTDTYFTVQGRKFLLNHGDTMGARGGDGFIGPLGPIKRGEGKVKRASEKMNLPFQHFIHGHYHQQYVLGNILSNGCTIGWNEYAKDELRAEPEPPQQILAFIHSDYGVIKYQPIFLDGADGVVQPLVVPKGGEFLTRSNRRPPASVTL